MNGKVSCARLHAKRDVRKSLASSGYLSMRESSSQLTLSNSKLVPKSKNHQMQTSSMDELSKRDRDVEVAYVHTVLSPPEGGWGWIVVSASTFVLFLTLGMSSVSGIVLLFVEKEYPNDPTPAVWIVGAMHSVTMAFVPIGRIICRQFGWRTTLFLGSSVCVGAYLLSFSATSVRYLIVTAGIMGGVANALCLTTSLLIIGQYFHQNWTLANTCVLSGAGVGLLVFPILVQRLLHDYGLHWTYLVLGGVSVCQYAALPALDPAHKHYTVQYVKSSEPRLDPNKDYNQLTKVEPVTATSIRQQSRIVEQILQKQSSNSQLGFSVLNLFREMQFCILTVSAVLIGSCLALPLTLLPYQAMPGTDYRNLTLGGVGFLLGLPVRTIFLKKVEVFYTYVLSAGLLASATLSIPLLCPSVVVCIAVLGLNIGWWGCALPGMVRETVGDERCESALDVVLILQSVFCLFVLAVTGFVKEQTSALILYYAIGACTLAGLIVTVIMRLRFKRNGRDWNIEATTTNM